MVWLFCEHKRLPCKQGHHVIVKKYSKPSIYNIILVASEKKYNVLKLSALGHGIYFLSANLTLFFFLCDGSRALHSRTLQSQKQIFICSSVFRGLTPSSSDFGTSTRASFRSCSWHSQAPEPPNSHLCSLIWFSFPNHTGLC